MQAIVARPQPAAASSGTTAAASAPYAMAGGTSSKRGGGGAAALAAAAAAAAAGTSSGAHANNNTMTASGSASSSVAADYQVRIEQRNGRPTEVITIADTPEPDEQGNLPPAATRGGGGAATRQQQGTTSSARGAYTGEPASKRRRGAAAPNDSAYPSQQQANGLAAAPRYAAAAAPATSSSYGSYGAPAANGSYGQQAVASGSSNNAYGQGGYAAQYGAPVPGSYSITKTSNAKGKRKYDQVASNNNNNNQQQQGSKAARGPNPDIDDKEGHLIIRINSIIAGRYQIRSNLGQGTFGKVVCARDLVTDQEVAVKVIRAIDKYRQASKVELRVLKTLQQNDPRNEHKCIHYIDTFDYENHVCIVTELLDISVFDFLKSNHYAPFPLKQIQSFARQLLDSVAFLHQLRLVHTDLKPENILLVSARSDEVRTTGAAASKGHAPRTRKVLKNDEIRLIDFGSATFEDEYHATVVSTRHYRAPEIILGMGWSYPCDVWSIGCILIEFFTGEALFQTHENLEHLAMMERVFGSMPRPYAREAARRKGEFFVSGATKDGAPRINFPTKQTPRNSAKFVKDMRPLKDIIDPSSDDKFRFLQLLRRLLAWDPNDRCTVQEALRDDFFKNQVE